MMEAILPRSWKDEFERAATARREDIAYREKTIRFETKERERREERAEERRERDEAVAAEFMLASTEDIKTFKVDLDRYDSVTVEALMENRDALEAVQQRLDEMMERAEVLPDGRRVFKTRDGQRVFDEHGVELSREAVDPSSIDDKKPRWESRLELLTEKIRLTEEREKLSGYQAKLDDVRERLDSGSITRNEFEKLKNDLRADMPEAVSSKLDKDERGNARAVAAPSVKAQDAAPLPDNMDAMMRQTGFAAPPSAPSL